jgi:DNA-binding response OmpR family regulator
MNTGDQESKKRILIVEDDSDMQQQMCSQLSARGYEVEAADNGVEALRVLEKRSFHLILLDITMPEMDGLEVCRRIRARSSVPIILVTAAERTDTKITALELGGDDYLTKPFQMGELIARIRAVLRRGSSVAMPSMIVAGDLTIDVHRREVRRETEVVHLTKIEFDLLHALVTQPDVAVSYDDLLHTAWGEDYNDIRLVHVHICNMRRKIERSPTGPRYILAIPGFGYRFRIPQ